MPIYQEFVMCGAKKIVAKATGAKLYLPVVSAGGVERRSRKMAFRRKTDAEEYAWRWREKYLAIFGGC